MSAKTQNGSIARVESAFKQLATAAQALNTASDDLSKVTRQLDASLRKLALGLTAWVQVSSSQDETQRWSHELGYANQDGMWGLALRKVTGYRIDNDESEQVWPFNDAPRALRMEAVDKIPDLLEQMLQKTEETTRTLRGKIEEASEVTLLVAGMTPTMAAPASQPWNRLALGSEGEGGNEGRSAARFRDTPALPVERGAAASASPAAGGASASANAAGRFREIDERPLPAERVAQS